MHDNPPVVTGGPAVTPQGAWTTRLAEIEAAAEHSRREAVSRWRFAYQDDSLNLFPAWVEQETFKFVASLLVGGRVASVTNLSAEGERLAGGIKLMGATGADIFYEAYDPPERQRFSIAHEIGHFSLHSQVILELGGIHSDGPHDYSEDSGDESADCLVDDDPVMEREADSFAAAFLMPAEQIEQDVDHFGRAVPFLAARYGVSRAALRRRLITLNLAGRFGEVK